MRETSTSRVMLTVVPVLIRLRLRFAPGGAFVARQILFHQRGDSTLRRAG